MPDEGTAQALRARLGAAGARHPAGEDPPPLAAGELTRHAWKPPARLVCSIITGPWSSAAKSPTEIPGRRQAPCRAACCLAAGGRAARAGAAAAAELGNAGRAGGVGTSLSRTGARPGWYGPAAAVPDPRIRRSVLRAWALMTAVSQNSQMLQPACPAARCWTQPADRSSAGTYPLINVTSSATARAVLSCFW